MEDKQLDFNQPLLSVRRLSSTGAWSKADEKSKTHRLLSKPPPPPNYKSDLNSGSMKHPGTVPFLWEKAPGRPKDENQPQPEAFQWPSSAPKLPPGKVFNLKQQNPDQTSSRALTYGEETVNKYKSSKENDAEDIGNCSSEDADEVFLDAFDTLSRTESLLMNCSATGLSSLDGSELKPSGPFDLNTRNFMIDRFLPAAKAIASEAPEQHIIKKQPNHGAQPREMKNISQERRPLNSHMPNYLAPYEIEEDDDYEGPENSSIKVCGLLPRFCLKGSFCLLNPLPGMRTDRSYARSSITSEEAVNEKRSVNGVSQSPPLHERKVKHGGQRNFRELLGDKSGSLSPVAEKTLYIDSTYEVKHPNSGSVDNGGTDSNLNAVDEMKVSKPKTLQPVEAFISLSERFKSEEETDLKEFGGESMKPIKRRDSVGLNIPNAVSLRFSKVGDVDKFDKQDAGCYCIKEGMHGLEEPSRSDKSLQFLALPLPKSPSDSWLRRTLQSTPPGNSALQYSLALQNH